MGSKHAVDEVSGAPAAALPDRQDEDFWFAQAADSGGGVDAAATRVHDAIGSAALRVDGDAVRRLPRGRHARSTAGREGSGPGSVRVQSPRLARGRLAALSALLLVGVIVLAVVANPPRSGAGAPRLTRSRATNAGVATLVAPPVHPPAVPRNAAGLLLSPITAPAPRQPTPRPIRASAHGRAAEPGSAAPAARTTPPVSPPPVAAQTAVPVQAPAPSAPPRPSSPPRLQRPAYRAPGPSVDQSYAPGDLPPASSTR